MAVEVVIGCEVGDLSEFDSVAGTADIESTTIRTGAYSVRIHPTTTGTGSVSATIGSTGNWTAVRFYFRAATLPSADSEEFFVGSTNFGLRIFSDGTIQFFDETTPLGSAGGTISINIWYRIDVVYGVNRSGLDDEGEAFIDGVSATSFSGVDVQAFPSASVLCGKPVDRNGETVDFFYDDLRVDTSSTKPSPIGASQIIARSPVTGTPTYTDWSGSFANVDETPTDGATTEDESPGSGDPLAQTYLIGDFDASQSGHGSETIGASDTINAGVVQLACARTSGGGRTHEIRERRDSVDTDDAVTLATAYALFATVIFTDILANLNGMEAGGEKSGGAAGQDMKISTIWVMVDYTPVAAGLPGRHYPRGDDRGALRGVA